jgi:hypothetical protein
MGGGFGVVERRGCGGLDIEDCIGLEGWTFVRVELEVPTSEEDELGLIRRRKR